nr:DeoR/GlpR family DNA-binding transcription regulator [Bhargavaea ginsengi]
MFVSERRDRIMEILQEKKRVTVKELASEMRVSEATLRTDFNMMEKMGMLKRTHGGAILDEEKPGQEPETSFDVRQKKNIEEKVKIAMKALELIKPKQCLLLDASSTALELAKQLKKLSMRLTIVTTGLHTALELKENPNLIVIMVGGVVTSQSSSIEGTLGIELLDSINIDMMFTSASGFTIENGLEDFNLYEVALKKEIAKRATNIIALVDSSKLGKSSSASFARLEDVDKLITDAPLDHDVIKEALAAQVDVLSTAEPASISTKA